MESNEEKPLRFGGIYNFFQGATINNIVINGNMTKSGTENYHNGHGEKAENQKFTDEQIARAIEHIVGKGKAVDSKQKWAGVYWYLRWACNFPLNARQACDRINQLPFSRELEYGCDYNNIRALTTLSFLNENPEQMDAVRYSKGDEQAFFQLREVVVALKDELARVARPKIGF